MFYYVYNKTVTYPAIVDLGADANSPLYLLCHHLGVLQARETRLPVHQQKSPIAPMLSHGGLKSAAYSFT